jgi:hypothetical protein
MEKMVFRFTPFLPQFVLLGIMLWPIARNCPTKLFLPDANAGRQSNMASTLTEAALGVGFGRGSKDGSVTLIIGSAPQHRKSYDLNTCDQLQGVRDPKGELQNLTYLYQTWNTENFGLSDAKSRCRSWE